MTITHRLRRDLGLVMVMLASAAVILLAMPAGALAESQERGKQQRDDSKRELREALEAAADPAAVESARAPTPEEEAEIGPGGKRMAATEAPVAPLIDGLVDDDVWALAEVVTDFLQREPVEGGVPSQRTEVRILFDDDNLYLGFVMYDEPDRVVASDLRRDSRLETDDSIAVLIDTFHDHRNGFLFRVNPLGTKYDATLQGERSINSRWDERWEAAARITPNGWEAELQIPFKAMRFAAGGHVWGIDFSREIRRTNEEVNWSNYRRGFNFRNVSQGGHLLGLKGLRLTGRYRVKPYLTGGYSALNATDLPLTERSGDYGIEDFKVQLSPNLTADLTVNTDFAQVEDDEERVNLTRFPLFFPERREFFLEGSDKFALGSSGGRGGGGDSGALLYHSRNIGLFDGTPVAMRYGAKLTGKIGNTSIGFINAQTGDNREIGYTGNNHTTLRLKQDIFDRSSVGVILTNVQGGGEHNRVGGIDASFRFFDHMSVRGYVAQARDSEVDKVQYVGALDAGWDSDLWSAQASVSYVDPDFATDMGFVRRHDMVRQSYRLGWKPRPSWSWMRQMMFFTVLEYVTDINGNPETREHTLWTRYQLESGDSASVMVQRSFERIREPFEVSDQAEIGAGDYLSNEWRVSFESYRARRLSGRVNASGGGFFGGTRSSYGGSMSMRFNEKLSLSPRYDFNRIELPTDAFDTHVASMGASYNFTERWLTSALVQYNSIAERLSIFARLNFIHRTGDDLFLVYKSTVRYDPEFYGLLDQAVIAKMTRSFDF
ncbi:MAG TPA: DUF5916 domain-containing protein [Acidobacteriota bacterium]|nr:DUF5916 domain-containing protein [Acidobacteriota bacterium]